MLRNQKTRKPLIIIQAVNMTLEDDMGAAAIIISAPMRVEERDNLFHSNIYYIDRHIPCNGP